jgi:hypothetical protein
MIIVLTGFAALPVVCAKQIETGAIIALKSVQSGNLGAIEVQNGSPLPMPFLSPDDGAFQKVRDGASC